MVSAFSLAQSSSIAHIRSMTDSSVRSFEVVFRVVWCGEVLATTETPLPCVPLFLHCESLRWSRLVACAILLARWDGPHHRFPKVEGAIDADDLGLDGEGSAEIVLRFPFDRDVDACIAGQPLSPDLSEYDTDTLFVEARMRVSSVADVECVVDFVREGRGVYYDKLDTRATRTDFHALARNKGSLAAALAALFAL